MQKNAINKLRMFKAVLEILKTNRSEWSENVGFVEVVADVEQALQAIDQARTQASISTSGITADKNVLIDEIIDQMMEISGSFATYAKRAGNNELYNKVVFTDAELERMPEEELAREAAQLAHLAQQHSDALVKYAVTTNEITLLQNEAAALAKKINEPRSAVAGRAAANVQLAQLLSATNLLLKEQMDGLVDKYRRQNPAFWNAYFNARKTVEYGTRHEKKTETAAVASN